MKYYAYNKTFKHYASQKESFDKESVEAFIEHNNKCKGGVWELHTEEQHNLNSRNEEYRDFLRQMR